MNALLIVILLAVVIGFVALIFMLNKLSQGKKDDQSLLMLQNQIAEINKTLSESLANTHKTIQQQFGQSSQIIQNVTEKLTRLDETNKQVVNFADQLRRLQDILKNPKQRGLYGEYQLEMLLRNAFQPHQYKMQYSLGKDEKTDKELIVDAVLFLGEKIIPIDAKFSLENYNRIVDEQDSVKKEQLENTFKSDLRKRIDETSKYIRPDKGTLDFAFMFIPAEGIFQDLMVNREGPIKVNTSDLIDYAISKKNVHIVSPTTFYVTIQALWQGLKEYKIQENTKEILKEVAKLGAHINAYEEYMKKLGVQLGTTVGTYTIAYKELAKIDKDVVKLTGGERSIEPLQLDKPQI